MTSTLAPGVPSEAGVVQGGLDLEFINGIWIGNGDATLLHEVTTPAAAEVVDVGSIHDEVVADVARSVYVDIQWCRGPAPLHCSRCQQRRQTW